MKILKNDLFDYKNRYIYQMEEGFKFSLDSILLAEFVEVKENLNILDMCTGNAVVPLILSTKTNSNICGFEIQHDIYKLAVDSVKLNNLENQIKIIDDDVKNIDDYFKQEFFSIITVNPPYFKNMGKMVNKNEYLSIARHEITINLEIIFKLSFKYLKNNGVLYIVHRVERLDDIIYLARVNNINVKEIQLILTKTDNIPTLVLCKCVKNSKSKIKFRKIVDVSKCCTYQHLFDRE